MGYLAIQSFGANTAADTAQAMQALLETGPSGFILDLRGNTGGLVSAGMPHQRDLSRFLQQEMAYRVRCALVSTLRCFLRDQ